MAVRLLHAVHYEHGVCWPGGYAGGRFDVTISCKSTTGSFCAPRWEDAQTAANARQYLNRKPLAHKPTEHLSYDEGLHLIRSFLEHSSKYTVEDLQAFSSQWVPHPQWVRVDHVEIPEDHLSKAADLSAARVRRAEQWRHRDEKPTRKQAVARLVEMLRGLAAWAEKDKLRLAPWIGVGCPGLIEADGRISRGAQNLPGNWQTDRFNLPEELNAALTGLSGATRVVLHNDAVVQGLSEAPFQRDDVTRWGVLTIGTGLGNARFTNQAGKAPAASSRR